MIHQYEWQAPIDRIDGYGDSDWAGCRVTGKSTSGGVLMRGTHYLKSWSRTQQSIALSSAEAELVAMVKVTAELIGITYLTQDWGNPCRGSVYADSTAALAIAKRKGSGKLRHINVGMLWIQEKRARDEIGFEKVEGKSNPADTMTKYLGVDTLQKMCTVMSIKWEQGRASAGLEVKS